MKDHLDINFGEFYKASLTYEQEDKLGIGHRGHIEWRINQQLAIKAIF